MRLAKFSFFVFLSFFLTSCFGPVKELKYQIEDSWDDETSFINDPLPLAYIDNKIKIKINHEFSLGGDALRNMSIANSDRAFYFASRDGEIFAVSLINYQTEWIYDHKKNITSGLSYGADKIYFVDYSGYLCALSLQGNLQWKIFVGEVFSKPMFYENSIVVKTSTNKFISLHEIDGSILWSYQLPSSPLPIRSWGDLVYSEKILYAGGSSGKLLALNLKNGLLVWESTFSMPKGTSDIQRSNDTTSTPIIDEFYLYAVSSNGNIASIDKDNGSILWSRPFSSFIGMTSSKENLFVTHNSGAIYGISKEDGSVIWRNADLIGRDVSKGTILNDLLVVSDFEGYLHIIDINDGKIISRINLGNDLLLLPIFNPINKNLIFSSLNGQISEISIPNLDIQQQNEVPKKENSIINENDNLNKLDREDINENDSFLEKLFFWK